MTFNSCPTCKHEFPGPDGAKDFINHICSSKWENYLASLPIPTSETDFSGWASIPTNFYEGR